MGINSAEVEVRKTHVIRNIAFVHASTANPRHIWLVTLKLMLICGRHEFKVIFNPRTDGGGGGISAPPPEFFPDSVKTAARSAAKFGITIPTFIAHITRNFNHIHVKVRSPDHVK